jgi:hypothetical protein
MEHTKESEERGRILVMLRSHVERCLQDIWESPELITDPDADYPYRYGTAACWVSILDGPELGVRVFAHAAVGVRPSAKLVREVNELNDNAVWVKVVLAGQLVGVSAVLHWSTVDRIALELAVRQVGGVADDIGVLLAGVYGGHTPFPADEVGQDQPMGGEAA